MKTIKSVVLVFCVFMFVFSCSQSAEQLDISYDLPKELNGLRIYDVPYGNGSLIKVAVLNNEVNSLIYKEGKHSSNVIIVKNKSRMCNVSQIIFENDSIIIARK
jgi:hypothetical protein